MNSEDPVARAMISELKDDIRELRADVRELLNAAHMGKGAWWLILRIGFAVTAMAGVIAWLFDKWPRK